jgi:hypothetical protein
MSKVSILVRGHLDHGNALKGNRKPVGRSHYEALRRHDLERHPVDTAVEARLYHRAVRRRVVQLQERIKSELGTDTQSFLELDALLNDERAEREEAYFNAGYEYGANAVRHRVLREMARRAWPKRLEHVAAHLRDEVMQAGLSSSETLLVLVESLWTLAVRAAPSDADQVRGTVRGLASTASSGAFR